MRGNGRTTCYGCGRRIPLASAKDLGYCDGCWWEICKEKCKGKSI